MGSSNHNKVLIKVSKKDSKKPAVVVVSREDVLLGVVVDVVEEATKFENMSFIFDKRIKYDEIYTLKN